MTAPKEEPQKKKTLTFLFFFPHSGDGNASFLRLKTVGSREVLNTYCHCVLCEDLKAELPSLN